VFVFLPDLHVWSFIQLISSRTKPSGMLRHADCQIIRDVSRDEISFFFRVEQSTLLWLGVLAQWGLGSFELLVIIYQSSCRNIPGGLEYSATPLWQLKILHQSVNFMLDVLIYFKKFLENSNSGLCKCFDLIEISENINTCNYKASYLFAVYFPLWFTYIATKLIFIVENLGHTDF